MRKTYAGAVLAATVLAVGGAVPAWAAEPPNIDEMVAAVNPDNVMGHLAELQKIADANGGNRASGLPGYEQSSAYVESVLAEAGYEPVRQTFQFPYYEVNSSSLVGSEGTEYENNPMVFAPSTDGELTAELVAPPTAEGCDAAAWGNVDATGKIALVKRGTCTFGEKDLAAAAAGAEAVVIYNNAEGALNGTFGETNDGFVPATGISQADGEALVGAMAAGPVSLTFNLDATSEVRETWNIIAETPGGRTDNVVMAGAHLDGVVEGPGINDNGSGSAALLETAVTLAKYPDSVNNKVRFAWWGAEELGLLGATNYVSDLQANNPAELKNIAGYLNFDMVGSPNYIVGVYDADESTYPAPEGVPIPAGSAALEKIFTDRFAAVDQAWVDTEFSGRSDYQPFIDADIPSSGLFSGADGEKTAEEVAKFGGQAGVLYDPNYHSAADDLDNVSAEAIAIFTPSIAHAIFTLAYDASSVNGKYPIEPTPEPSPTGTAEPSPTATTEPSATGAPDDDDAEPVKPRPPLADTGAASLLVPGALAGVALAGAGYALTRRRR